MSFWQNKNHPRVFMELLCKFAIIAGWHLPFPYHRMISPILLALLFEPLSFHLDVYEVLQTISKWQRLTLLLFRYVLYTFDDQSKLQTGISQCQVNYFIVLKYSVRSCYEKKTPRKLLHSKFRPVCILFYANKNWLSSKVLSYGNHE